MVEIKTLNPQQKNAVKHYKGPALVVAGAGTGKTAVITTRIAYLVKNRSVPPENILAVTFTEKAANEMQQRVDQLLPIGVVDVDILTFHGLGDRILRDNAHEVGLPSDFVVMSQFQQILLMQRVINGLKISYYKPLSNPFSFVNAILQFISKLKDENITSDKYSLFTKEQLKKIDNSDKEEKTRLKELENIYSSYNKLCETEGLIDYGDQILKTISLLESKPSLKRIYQNKYQFMLVDEFQDTNYTQAYLISMLSEKHQNIMVVGDDDQSIYRFRGAAISNILNFEKTYKNTKKIILTKNYRSVQKILDCSYSLIQNNNPYRLETEIGISKKLKSNKSNVGEVRFMQFNNILEETDSVAEKIGDMVKKRKISYSDIAILLRKNNQAKLFADSLQKYNIPFITTESQDLLEQSEIKFLINFINSINDPHASVSLYGLLNSDLYGFTLAELATFSSQASRRNQELEEYILTQGSDKLKKIIAVIHNYRLQSQELSAGQLIYKYLEDSGFLKKMVEKAKTDSLYAVKIQNISQFFSIIREFERIEYNNPTIYAFWRYINGIIQSQAEVAIQPSPLDVNAVSVMTIHKAKGLEFEAVFLVDLNHLTFPTRNQPDPIRYPEGLFYQEDKKIDWHTQEERRLFYVAMTRAKTNLFLSQSFDHGGKQLKKPSKFIQEALNTKINSIIPNDSEKVLRQIQAFRTLADVNKEPTEKLYNKNNWLHLSTNQIADYIRSPLEFWYFNVLNLPKGPFHALVYGSAIHAAIEFYYKSKISKTSVKLVDMYKIYENSWKSEGFVSQSHEQQRFNNGKKALKLFYNKQQKLKNYAKYVEKPFLLQLDDFKLEISGRYDAVFEENGKVEIRDFKTGDIKNEKMAQNRLADSIQMQIYGLAWQKTQSSYLEKLSLHFVEKDIIVSTDRINIQKTTETLKKVCEGIRKQEFNLKGSSRINFNRYL